MPSAVTTIRAAEAGEAMPAPAVEASAFRTAMGSFPTGVTVVTVASADGNMHGITVNSFSSVSLDPMLVLVCLNQASPGAGLIERAGAFAVNVLSAGQQDIARWFASRYRPAGPAMFDGVDFEPGVTGCPVVAGAAASFDCQLRQSHRAGDHLIVLGEVVALVHRPQLEPLIFQAGSYQAPDHEPRRQATRLHVVPLSAGAAASHRDLHRSRRILTAISGGRPAGSHCAIGGVTTPCRPVAHCAEQDSPGPIQPKGAGHPAVGRRWPRIGRQASGRVAGRC